jgi:hypothetical protein
MHLVRHREVVEALAQVPPAMPSEFAPDVDTALRIVATALADGHHWLDPIEIKRLFDAYEIAIVPAFAAADPDEGSPMRLRCLRMARPSCSRSCRATSSINPMSAASSSISPVLTRSARQPPIFSHASKRATIANRRLQHQLQAA